METTWPHLNGFKLADPDFGEPGKMDLLLGIDIFSEVLRQGRRTGPPSSPCALHTDYGWVLCGKTELSQVSPQSCTQVVIHHAMTTSTDDILKRLWEIEEPPSSGTLLSSTEKSVLQHFKEKHTRNEECRFIVPPSKKPDARSIGESWSHAIRRFLSLEKSLHLKEKFQQVDQVVQEYMELGHAELVPATDLNKRTQRCLLSTNTCSLQGF